MNSTWVTVLGNISDTDTRLALDAVLDWAIEKDITFSYREAWPWQTADHGVTETPTMRFFDLSSAVPRIEKVGIAEIRAFLDA